MRCQITVWLLATLFAWPQAADAAPNEPPTSGPLPATVTVQAADVRFQRLAENVAAEIETLVEVEGVELESWRVRLLPPQGLSPESAAPQHPLPENQVSLSVVVGLHPGETSKPSASQRPVITVNPVGWPESTISRPGMVSAAPLERVVEADLKEFHDLLHKISRPNPTLSILVDPWLSEAWPALERAAKGAGVSVRRLDVRELGADVEGLRAGDVVYLPPGLNMEAEILAAVLIEHQAIGFSGRDRADADAGIFGAMARQMPRRLARLTALEVLSTIRGLPTLEPEAVEPRSSRLVLNLSTASRLSLTVPWRVELAAELVGESLDDAEELTLRDARFEALEANLDLQVRALETAAGEEDVRAALAALRPRLGLSTRAGLVDEDSAEAAFGANPERLVTMVGEASLTLLSEDARAAVDVARGVQLARELGLQDVRLEIGLEGSAALLEVARRRVFERVERDQLARTYADLSAAEDRQAVGAGGRADVARLEARAAQDRQSLIAAYGERRAAEITLNRLLDRPLNNSILPRIDGVTTTGTAASLPLETWIVEPTTQAELRQEMLALAKERAPSIAAAEFLVAARERESVAARRAFYLPRVQASAEVSTRLLEDGRGVDPPRLFGADSFPATPDSAWRLGLDASLTLLDGGARRSRRARAELELDTARRFLESTQQQVEERTRRSLLGLETSYETVHHAREAVEASRRALDVIADGYALGAESLTTLLAARNEFRTAQLSSAAASYAALANWLEVQRASGGFLDAESLRTLESRLQKSSRAHLKRSRLNPQERYGEDASAADSNMETRPWNS